MSQTNKSRMLHVSSNSDTVGFLREELSRLSFEYAPSWLEKPDAFPIAPCFPLINTIYFDGEEHQSVAWFFDNFLPEEKQREFVAAESGVSKTDTWGLLRYCGAETAGALTLRPADFPDAPASQSLLSPEQLASRIQTRSHASMMADAPKQTSLAGAQPKLAALDEEVGLYEPSGSQLSSHILKPNSDSQFYPNSAANEHFCMILAAAVGLQVPLTKLHYVPDAVFSVERFDRMTVGGQCLAKHIVDGTQLLALSRHQKYQMMTVETLNQCCRLCADPEATGRRIFDWAVFNVLIGNSDAHLKNLSFFVDRQTVTLAPFYDLLSTAAYATPDNWPFAPHWPEVKLSMQIGQAQRYQEITRGDFLKFAACLRIPQVKAERQLDTLVAEVADHAAKISDEITVKPAERRLLHLIQQLPIREMSRRLGRQS